MKTASSNGRTRLDRLRWRLWSWLSDRPNVCPSNAYTLVIYANRCDPRIDWMCRKDCVEIGVCWCGKLTAPIDGDGCSS